MLAFVSCSLVARSKLINYAEDAKNWICDNRTGHLGKSVSSNWVRTKRKELLTFVTAEPAALRKNRSQSACTGCTELHLWQRNSRTGRLAEILAPEQDQTALCSQAPCLHFRLSTLRQATIWCSVPVAGYEGGVKRWGSGGGLVAWWLGSLLAAYYKGLLCGARGLGIPGWCAGWPLRRGSGARRGVGPCPRRKSFYITLTIYTMSDRWSKLITPDNWSLVVIFIFTTCQWLSIEGHL